MRVIEIPEYNLIGLSVEERIRKAILIIAKEGYRVTSVSLPFWQYSWLETASISPRNGVTFTAEGLAYMILGTRVQFEPNHGKVAVLEGESFEEESSRLPVLFEFDLKIPSQAAQ